MKGVMPAQLDMFSAAMPTFAPWADPARAANIVVEREVDRDNVEPNGSVGTNREVYVLVVEDANGEVLRSETFKGEDAHARARALQEEILTVWSRNQQSMLGL